MTQKVPSTCRTCGAEGMFRLRGPSHAGSDTSKMRPEPYCDKCRNVARRIRARLKVGLPPDVSRHTLRERGKRQSRDPNAARVCPACKELKEGTEFASYPEKGSGRIRTRLQCKPCFRAYRRTGYAAKRPVPKIKCRVCNAVYVSKKGRRCTPCYRKQEHEKTLAIIAKLPPKPEPRPRERYDNPGQFQAQKRAEKLEKSQRKTGKTSENVALVCPGEWWVKQYTCGACRKPTLWMGMCYRCATGKERTILRPDERRAA